MNYYNSTSFNQMYYLMLQDAFFSELSLSKSRVGKVKDMGPCVYQIQDDPFRLCFLRERNINPFFAYAEFSWILKGMNKLQPLEYFISNYGQFSDDGITLNGAYGFRLISYFGFDQIETAISLLQKDANSRRVVLTMFSPQDLLADSRDIPCNTTIYLKIRNNKLDITILNRSNDLYLGVPYNVFVFYLLQVYIAKRLNCELGVQTHYSDSLHLYARDIENVEKILKSNCVQEITSIEKRYGLCDNSEYVLMNHNYILHHDFEMLKSSQFKVMFSLFKDYKREKTVDFKSIPQNLIGYCMYNWFNKVHCVDKKDVCDFINKGINMSKNDILRSLIYDTPEHICTVIKEMKVDYLCKYDELKSLFDESTKNSFIQININNTDTFIYIMLLVVVSEGMFSEIYNRDARMKLTNKFNQVCDALNITSSDFNYFLNYKEDIIKIICSVE